MKEGRASTMTHDYKCHGVTTLFAALDVLESKVIGQCMKRHRHQEFIRFLNVIEAMTPKRKAIHVIVDNYATHTPPTKVMEWLREASAVRLLLLDEDIALSWHKQQRQQESGFARIDQPAPRMDWEGRGF